MDINVLKEKVLAAIQYDVFYREYVKEAGEEQNGWVTGRCPFHDDNAPSFSYSPEHGGWKCFAGCGSGDIFDFWATLKELDIEQFGRVVKSLAAKVGVTDPKQTIDMALVVQWNRALLKNPDRLAQLAAMGIEERTVKEYFLGWDGERVTIPIFDEEDDCVNVRRYSPNSSGKNKMLSYASGYGTARLYPLMALEEDVVHIFEGEKDMLNARQRGINAITTTGGASTWRQAWNKLFEGKHVIICYDCDKEGRNGADKIAQQLWGMAASVKIVDLGIEDPPKGDFTNFIVDLGHTAEDYLALVEATQEFNPFGNAPADSPKVDDTVYRVPLNLAAREVYYNRTVEIPVVVAGKDLTPYMIPHKVNVRCEDRGGKVCDTCPFRRGAPTVLEFGPSDPRLLKMVSCSDDQLKGLIRKEVGVPASCRNFVMEPDQMYSVTAVRLIPEPEFTADDTAEYVARQAYVVEQEGKEAIQANTSYVVTGKTIPDPKNQYATHLIFNADPAQDSISSFTVTEELTEELRIFEGDDPRATFAEIVNDLSANVTRIYGRPDLHIAIDLVFHSPLMIVFQDQLTKGWLDALVIGDTRSGKSETAMRLRQHYMVGEIITAENVSYAGLVGGVSKVGDHWHLTWGRLPLNDGRLLVIDEVSGMPIDDIGRMSGIRSSGIAEIQKINNERTWARCRLLWCSNPRSDRSLSAYNAGVEAIRQLIGRPEDIARFEFAITCASNEVPSEVINAYERPKVEHKFTSDLCHKLVLWAWSRRPDQIFFSPDAEKAILKYALEMGRTYSPKIPLVEGANQRLKLARIAAAVAARMHSTDPSGESLLVNEEHAEFAYHFLTVAYSKPSMRYLQWSEDQVTDVNDDEIESTNAILDEYPDAEGILRRVNRFSITDLQDMLDIERDEAKKLISTLAKNGMIQRSSSGYYKTEALIRILIQRRDLPIGGDAVLENRAIRRAAAVPTEF